MYIRVFAVSVHVQVTQVYYSHKHTHIHPPIANLDGDRHRLRHRNSTHNAPGSIILLGCFFKPAPPLTLFNASFTLSSASLT